MYNWIINVYLKDSKIDTGKPKPIQKRPWGNKSSSNDDRLEHLQNNVISQLTYIFCNFYKDISQNTK